MKKLLFTTAILLGVAVTASAQEKKEVKPAEAAVKVDKAKQDEERKAQKQKESEQRAQANKIQAQKGEPPKEDPSKVTAVAVSANPTEPVEVKETKPMEKVVEAKKPVAPKKKTKTSGAKVKKPTGK